MQVGKYMRAGIAALSVCAAALAQADDFAPPSDTVLEQRLELLHSATPGTIWDLQVFRDSRSAVTADGDEITLTSLNPHINAWFVLEIRQSGRRQRLRSYHLENADPARAQLALSAEGAVLVDGVPCALSRDDLETASDSPLPYVPLCDGAFYLRNPVSGSRTTREAVAEFLRSNVIFGDQVVNLVKGTFYQDAFLQSSDESAAQEAGAVVAAMGHAALARAPVMYASPGFELRGAEGGMEAGSWYAVEDAPGIYASVMKPGMIAPEILSRRGEANGLDGVERGADVYLVAFDMQHFEMGYEVGTAHPALGWSSRPSGAGRDWRIDGPDGFAQPAPLVRVGALSPALAARVAATFTGGYKRDHGAFRYGDMAYFNHGHHYGFLQQGVIWSRLWPGLSTIYVLDDGRFGMVTWTEELDTTLLPHLRFARQNGVPLIEPGPDGIGLPGPLVTQWGQGNWSGSAEAQLRTLRAGACVKEVDGRDFLIYAYFSTATPSAMARTFQAYGCRYAMLLDMNSQEHTYMAAYPGGSDRDFVEAQHLVPGMASIDAQSREGPVPRFVSNPDNRDFFYLLRKE